MQYDSIFRIKLLLFPVETKMEFKKKNSNEPVYLTHQYIK